MKWYTWLENTLLCDQNANGKDLQQFLSYYPLSWSAGLTIAIHVKRGSTT